MLSNIHLKNLLRNLIFILGFLIILFLALFTTIDRSPYKGQDYYYSMMSRLDTVAIVSNKSLYFKAGWGKVNITPNRPVPIAGYGIRESYKGVHDSIWVRSFVFDNGKTKAAIVILDLLIFPPKVKEILLARLPEGFDAHNVHFSATHTHNSAGGWAEGLGGRFLAGKYSPAYVEQLARAIIKSLEIAQRNFEEAELIFFKRNADFLVKNRLVKNGRVDPFIRVIKIKKKSGRNGLIVSFSAHATCLSSKEDFLSRDYPGAIIDSLETEEKIEFAAFLAGSVGSQTPQEFNKSNYELMGLLAQNLKRIVLRDIEEEESITPKEITFKNIPIELREPQFRVGKDFRFRPWVFNFLMGKQSASINLLKIGKLILIGTPCDFSGPLFQSYLENSYDGKHEIMITSFNGGYIGYITEDQFYDLKKFETREMNWFGPYNGSYFIEIIDKLIKKVE